MAEPLATISPVTGLGMIQIRAELEKSGPAIAKATGLPMPDVTLFTTQGARLLAWMSPDELLLVLPGDEVAGAVQALEDALKDAHSMVVDVSDMRAVFDVIGPHAADTLAKLAPVDFDAMKPDELRRTRLAQTACGIWSVSGGYRVIGFRSVADYMRGILTVSARPGTSLAPR